ISLAVITGNPVFDAFGSIAIGVLLILVAIVIGIEVKDLLIGQSVEEAERTAIRGFIEEQAEVDKVMSLLTLQMGEEIVIAVKASMHEGDARRMIAHINRIEERLRKRFPAIRWIFFEPDVAD
ncbi:MAG: cation efflux family transporter, partial [Burkholderiales bacterium]|nr:cation efflux family transporter [Burkholderiales bacterium]